MYARTVLAKCTLAIPPPLSLPHPLSYTNVLTRNHVIWTIYMYVDESVSEKIIPPPPPPRDIICCTYTNSSPASLSVVHMIVTHMYMYIKQVILLPVGEIFGLFVDGGVYVL